jgi:hypothetical protein
LSYDKFFFGSLWKRKDHTQSLALSANLAWMDFVSSYSQFYVFLSVLTSQTRKWVLLAEHGISFMKRVPLSKKEKRINVHPAVKGPYRTLAATNVGVPTGNRLTAHGCLFYYNMEPFLPDRSGVDQYRSYVRDVRNRSNPKHLGHLAWKFSRVYGVT